MSRTIHIETNWTDAYCIYSIFYQDILTIKLKLRLEKQQLQNILWIELYFSIVYVFKSIFIFYKFFIKFFRLEFLRMEFSFLSIKNNDSNYSYWNKLEVYNSTINRLDFWIGRCSICSQRFSNSTALHDHCELLSHWSEDEDDVDSDEFFFSEASDDAFHDDDWRCFFFPVLVSFLLYLFPPPRWLVALYISLCLSFQPFQTCVTVSLSLTSNPPQFKSNSRRFSTWNWIGFELISSILVHCYSSTRKTIQVHSRHGQR